MNIEILHIPEDFVKTTLVRNVTKWLANPGGTKFLKLMEEMCKEKLNGFLKSFCSSAKKKDGTLSVYKSSSMKFI